MEKFKKIISIISLLSLLNANAGIINPNVNISTPECPNNSVYNKVSGVCQTNSICPNGGTLKEDGTCESNTIGTIENVYKLKTNLSPECSGINYDTKNILPEGVVWFDKTQGSLYKTKELSVISEPALDLSYLIPGTPTACSEGYSLGGTTGDLTKCEKTIDNSSCPTGEIYNKTTNKCERYSSGIATEKTAKAMDYTGRGGIERQIEEEKYSATLASPISNVSKNIFKIGMEHRGGGNTGHNVAVFNTPGVIQINGVGVDATGINGSRAGWGWNSSVDMANIQLPANIQGNPVLVYNKDLTGAADPVGTCSNFSRTVESEISNLINSGHLIEFYKIGTTTKSGYYVENGLCKINVKAYQKTIIPNNGTFVIKSALSGGVKKELNITATSVHVYSNNGSFYVNGVEITAPYAAGYFNPVYIEVEFEYNGPLEYSQCPNLYTLFSGECIKYTIKEKEPSCPAGYLDNGVNCEKAIDYKYYGYSCPAGEAITDPGITNEPGTVAKVPTYEVPIATEQECDNYSVGCNPNNYAFSQKASNILQAMTYPREVFDNGVYKGVLNGYSEITQMHDVCDGFGIKTASINAGCFSGKCNRSHVFGFCKTKTCEVEESMVYGGVGCENGCKAYTCKNSTGISCPAGTTKVSLGNGKESCLKMKCPEGSYDTGTSCLLSHKVDPNKLLESPSLGDPLNSPTPPANNCKKETSFSCGAGIAFYELEEGIDMCYYATTFTCPTNTTQEEENCRVAGTGCNFGYTLVGNSCNKNVYTCPSDYVETGDNTCSKSELTCPAGTIEAPGGTKPCKKVIPAQCPLGYEGVPNDSTKCRMAIFNPECKTEGVCQQEKITCPTGSKAKLVYEENGVKKLCSSTVKSSCPTGTVEMCISDKEAVCEKGQKFNQLSQKCEKEPSCPEGYKFKDEKCQKEYSYSSYSCPSGFDNPLEVGVDCLATCGKYGCECNSSTPPANNCKKPAQEAANQVTILKKRPIMEHQANGSLSLEDFNTFKGFSCGENCLFNVNKITGDNENLCFEKKNGEKGCFKVSGCSFKGEIKNDLYPNDIEELNVSNQFTISTNSFNNVPLTSENFSCSTGVYNPNIKACEKDKGNACPNGSVWNESRKQCDSTDMIKVMEVNGVYNIGNIGNGGGGCNEGYVYNVSLINNGNSTYKLNYTLRSDSNEQIKSQNISINEPFIDTYAYGRDISGIKVNLAEGIVYSRYCKNANDVFVPVVALDGFAKKQNVCRSGENIVNGKCIEYINPSCSVSGFNWDTSTRNCIKNSSTNASKIESTCKINGHVGWHSRNGGGITAIKVDPINKGKLLFYDSFMDKELGFIEFVKDVNPEDRKNSYVPENTLLYDMLGNGYTASEKAGNNTYFSTDKKRSSSDCTGTSTNLGMSLITETNENKNLLKILTGDRAVEKQIEPKCIDGKYLFSVGKCIQSRQTTCPNGKYERIPYSNQSELINNSAIWDSYQGDNPVMNGSIMILTTGKYKIHTATMGTAQIILDGQLVNFVSFGGIKENVIEVVLTEGIHELKIVATKDIKDAQTGAITGVGALGVAVKILNDQNQKISSSEEWCKNTANSFCPTEGFVKKGNLCLSVSIPYCKEGEFRDGFCVVEPRCVLSKFQGGTFFEQAFAIKKELRTAPKSFKCSPLTCQSGQCKTATCEAGYSGTLSSLPIGAGECVDSKCDAFKPYHKVCGKQGGCDKSNPLVFEENGVCKELYCASGFILDTKTKTCKKLACPKGSIEKPDGSCVK